MYLRLINSLRYANVANLASIWLPSSNPIRLFLVEIYECLHMQNISIVLQTVI
jgi:hypothetical protein